MNRFYVAFLFTFKIWEIILQNRQKEGKRWKDKVKKGKIGRRKRKIKKKENWNTKNRKEEEEKKIGKAEQRKILEYGDQPNTSSNTNNICGSCRTLYKSNKSYAVYKKSIHKHSNCQTHVKNEWISFAFIFISNSLLTYHQVSFLQNHFAQEVLSSPTPCCFLFICLFVFYKMRLHYSCDSNRQHMISFYIMAL